MIVIDRKPPCRIVAWHRVLCDNSIARNITLHLTILKTLKTIESSQNVHCACTNKPRIRLDKIPILKKTNQRNATATIRNWRTYVRACSTHVCKYVCMYVHVAYRLCSGLQQLHASCTHSKVSIHASTHTRYNTTPLYHTTWDETRRNKTRCDETKRDEMGRHGTRRDKTRRDEAIRHNATHHASASGEYIRAR